MMTNIDVKIRNPYNNCILRKIIYHQYLPMLIGIYDLMGAQTDRLRCEVCQNLILSPMNTGPLRSAVATASTVYGIETVQASLTVSKSVCSCNSIYRLRYWNSPLVTTVRMLPKLQQHLPFTVLKRSCYHYTVYVQHCQLQQHLPFTVLKRPNSWNVAWHF